MLGKILKWLGLIGSLTVIPAYANAGELPIQMPNNNVTSFSDVMHFNKVSSKTMTLINNSDETIYPVLIGANYIRIYDPNDATDLGYRAYVGYDDNGTYMLGLKPNSIVTIPVPQAFWNAGRMQLFDANPIPSYTSNTFTYDVSAHRYTVETGDTVKTGDTLSKKGLQRTQGVLMLYRASSPMAISLDAPSQLIEFTYRDILEPPYRNLINYDVSYVDSMYLPVAMEAQSPSGAQVGYIGTGMSVDKMQDLIHSFANNNGNFLGNYFHGSGWPKFNIPADINSDTQNIKIPSAFNLFALAGATSSFDSQKMLNMGDPEKDNDQAKKITSLWFSWVNYYETKVTKFKPVPVISTQGKVELIPLDIPNDEKQKAAEFSKVVYNVVYNFNQAFPNATPSELVRNIIGFYLPGGASTTESRTLLTTQVQSLLRGVADDTKDSDWYPNPAGQHAIYNLDPFVWFAHVQLGTSGYGFSIDDGVADVSVNGANSLYVAIGGTAGLPNQTPYNRNPGNKNPSPEISTSANLVKGDTIELNGSASKGDGGIESYQWVVTHGDNHVNVINSTQEKASFVAGDAGTYTVTLKVTDGSGLSASKALKIIIQSKPSPSDDRSQVAISTGGYSVSVGGQTITPHHYPVIIKFNNATKFIVRNGVEFTGEELRTKKGLNQEIVITGYSDNTYHINTP